MLSAGMSMLAIAAACTAIGETDSRQLQGAGETADVVSTALAQGTAQAAELTSLRATVNAIADPPDETPVSDLTTSTPPGTSTAIPPSIKPLPNLKSTAIPSPPPGSTPTLKPLPPTSSSIPTSQSSPTAIRTETPIPTPTVTPQSEVFVAGVLTGTTTWQDESVQLTGPVLITGRLNIFGGTTLDLNGHTLRIDGVLNAIGTETAMVEIVGFSEVSSNSVIVGNSGNAEFRFVTVNVTSSEAAIVVESAGSIFAVDSSFVNPRFDAVWIESTAFGRFERMTLCGSGRRAIVVFYRARLQISDSLLCDQGDQGLYLSDDSEAFVFGNTFEANGIGHDRDGAGIRAERGAAFSVARNLFQRNQNGIALIDPNRDSIIITQNIFEDNLGHAMKAISNNEWQNNFVIQAPANYWGEAGSSEPEDVIFDYDDDFRLAQIVPADPLTENPTNTP